MEREPTQMERDVAQAVSHLAIGTARAMAALANAVARQQGIDENKLLDDWIDLIPAPESEGSVEYALYRAIELTLTPSSSQPRD